MTKILNALAFANVGNEWEFERLLRQVDLSSVPGKNQARRGTGSAASGTTSGTPGIRHVQGAL